MSAIGPYLYILPALLLVSIMLLLPVFFTLGISFTKWDLLSDPQWVGFAQYQKVFQSSKFLTSLGNTLLWTVGTLLVPVLLGLLLAVALDRVAGERIYKFMIYLPRVLAPTVLGVIWSFIYARDGLLNEALRLIGLEDLARSWLLTPPVNTFAMIGTFTWGITGINMILFLVGLQTISKEIVEAAKIEGASEWKIFTHIKLPLLGPITTIVVTMSVIGSFTTFDLVWVMTKGGPYGSSETLAVTMFNESFNLFHVGTGAAIAIVLSLCTLGFSILYLRTVFKRERAREQTS